MKAITLHQPWASLIAMRVKAIETRGWSTKYRGPLAIHAAKRQPDQALRVGDYVVGWEYEAPSHPVLWHNPPGIPWPRTPEGDFDRSTPHTDLPLGQVVATCMLLDVYPIRDSMTSDTSGDYIIVGDRVGMGFNESGGHFGMYAEVPYGDYTPGRFAWLLGSIKSIEPVPAKGKQGFWEWSK